MASHQEAVVLDERQRQIVKHVIECERIGSEALWEAADGMAKLYADGLTQRQIAELIGKSQTHVNICLRAVRDYPGNQKERPPWSEAYSQAKYRGPTPEEIKEGERQTADPDHVWEWKGLSKDAAPDGLIDRDLLGHWGIRIYGNVPLPDGSGRRVETRLVVPKRVKVQVRPARP